MGRTQADSEAVAVAVNGHVGGGDTFSHGSATKLLAVSQRCFTYVQCGGGV